MEGIGCVVGGGVVGSMRDLGWKQHIAGSGQKDNISLHVFYEGFLAV